MKLKYADDYYDQILERYPGLEKWEVDKIIKHGLKTFYILNSYGADILMKSCHSGFMCYFGKLFRNKETWWKYWTLKWKIKLRLQYNLKCKQWDGYFYFGMTDEEYKEYLSKKKGRLKYKYKFPKFQAFKVFEEACLPRYHKHFFRISGLDKKGFVFRAENFETRNFEYIGSKNSEGKIELIK